MPDDLIFAIRGGKLPAVRAAIKANPESVRGPRPAIEAARRAFQPALELLHKHGAGFNGAWKGYRPLHSLLQEDPHADAGRPTAERLACLDWLLEHGADPEQLGAWPPARAIIIAAFVGRPEYVEHLRQAGARIDGFTGAALGDRTLVERALAERPDFARERDSGGLTALQCACGSRLPGAPVLDIARRLLDAGAEIAARTKSWSHEVDAPYFAASAKNVALFKLLLERGADPTEALVHPAWDGHEEMGEMALSHGADPDRARANGKPLLNDLIRWGQVTQTLWLLAHGASPNVPDDQEGWTAVHQAASRGNLRLMQALLQAGGDLTCRDRHGSTPLDVAQACRRSKLIGAMAQGTAP